jgi:pimeloyl-ACP methyl ester carboxylesterase
MGRSLRSRVLGPGTRGPGSSRQYTARLRVITKTNSAAPEGQSGERLVLLHGAGDNSLDWRWVIPDLAATHRVYAPDLPGSPDSARPDAAYSPAFFERFVAAFVGTPWA